MSEPVPRQYRHFKGGEYEVIGMAWHSEMNERLVVYPHGPTRVVCGSTSWRCYLLSPARTTPSLCG